MISHLPVSPRSLGACSWGEGTGRVLPGREDGWLAPGEGGWAACSRGEGTGSMIPRRGDGARAPGERGQSTCFWEALSPTQTEKQGVAATWRPPPPRPLEQASLLLTLGTSRLVWDPRSGTSVWITSC